MLTKCHGGFLRRKDRSYNIAMSKSAPLIWNFICWRILLTGSEKRSFDNNPEYCRPCLCFGEINDKPIIRIIQEINLAVVLKPGGLEISGCSKLTIEKIYATFYRKVLQQSQEANYITTLDLQREPFSPEPDSLFYYSFNSFEQRLTVLDGLVQGTDPFVLVIGEPGSGKTTLLERYLASIDVKWKYTRIQTAAENAAVLSNGLQDQNGYPAYVLQDVADPIVIVDDAHRLPPEELKFLIQKSLVPGSNDRIKRLVLFGESELYTAVTGLTASLSDQPAVNKIHLPGLTEEETVDYLRHRLAIAGFEGELPLNSSEVKAVHQTSGGIPGSINQIVHNRISDKYSNKKGRPKYVAEIIGNAPTQSSLDSCWRYCYCFAGCSMAVFRSRTADTKITGAKTGKNGDPA